MNCPATSLNEIQKLMFRGGRIVLNARFDTPSLRVLHDLKWLTLHERLKFHSSVMMYKCVNHLSPGYLSEKFGSADHGYNTRCAANLKVPKFKTKKGQSAFMYKGAKIWNEIPTVIRNSSSLDCFKHKIIQHILNVHST
jgi:hypothetical protein